MNIDSENTVQNITLCLTPIYKNNEDVFQDKGKIEERIGSLGKEGER